MFQLKAAVTLINFLVVVFSSSAFAKNKITIENFVTVGGYKLISGPRDLCPILEIEPGDLEDSLRIGARHSFSLEESYKVYPSEATKGCNMNRRNIVKVIDKNKALLAYEREEVCQGKIDVQQTIQVNLTKGEVQLTNTAAKHPGYTCVWKLKQTSTKEKK